MKGKISLALSTILLPSIIWAQSAGNQLHMHQQGSYLEAVVDQGFEGHTLDIEQIGHHSSVEVVQVLEETMAAPGHRASIRQHGNYNLGVLRQTFEAASASLEQVGNQHEAHLSQPFSWSGRLEVIQHGFGNYSQAIQRGVYSTARIEQYGNVGIVRQNEGGFMNNSAIAQQLEGSGNSEINQFLWSDFSAGVYASAIQGEGSLNYIDQNISGSESSVYAIQTGSLNQAYQSLSGYRLSSNLSQDGFRNEADIVINGSYHSGSINQRGNNNTAYIAQTGSTQDRFTSNSAVLFQSGHYNQANFDQQNGGHVRLDQNGNHHTANIQSRNSGNTGWVDAYNLIAEQTGSYTIAEISYQGLDVRMQVSQNGTYLFAEIDQSGGSLQFNQSGTSNYAHIENRGNLDFLQTGRANGADIVDNAASVNFNQTGNSNFAILDRNSGQVDFVQSGDGNNGFLIHAPGNQRGNAIFEQSGDANVGMAYQTGHDLSLEFYQRGSGNHAELRQTGSNNSLELYQNTNGNSLLFHQNGHYNTATIIQ